MKKTLIVSLIVVALLCTMVFVFTACDTGKYENSDLGYINLKIGGKFVQETKLGSSTTKVEGKYEIEKADEKGNKKVTFTNDDGKTLFVGNIDKDGVLWIGLVKYVK